MKPVTLMVLLAQSMATAFCPGTARSWTRDVAAGRRAPCATRLAALIKPEKDFLIAPSILSANFAALGNEVDNVMNAGADVVHFDVMDNHFVPNLTIGPLVCKALRDHGVTHDIDVHLMVSPVDRIVGDFAAAGATYITFHPEATFHVDRTLQLIQSMGCKAGLVLNPSTSLDSCKHVMDKLDILLLMSVNPGFGGQAFIPSVLHKAREARRLIDESGYGETSRESLVRCFHSWNGDAPLSPPLTHPTRMSPYLFAAAAAGIRLEIDGGVSSGNIQEIARSGVDMFVIGSALFTEPRTEVAYRGTIDRMRRELAKAKTRL